MTTRDQTTSPFAVTRRRGYVVMTAALVVSAALMAHEGHQPLPTRGIQVDLKQGRVILSNSARELIGVETVEVTQREGLTQIRGYAMLTSPWDAYAFVTSRLPGRVVSLDARAGESVTAGQVLAEIESLELQSLRLEYQQTRSDLELSAAIVESLSPAATAGSVPMQRLVEAELTHRQNQNALQVLRSKAQSLNVEELRLDSPFSQPITLPILSPIAGTIVHSDLTIGKVVDPTEHLMDVVNPARLQVRIGLVEPRWPEIAPGQQVRLSFPALPGHDFSTTIDRLGLMFDARTQQGLVLANLDNSSAPAVLRPGMKGVAEITRVTRPKTLSVPVQAVRSDGAERYVLVAEAERREGAEYQKVPVVVGPTQNGQTEIHGGKVLPGDRVVTTGGHQLASVFFSETLQVGPETARAIGLQVERVALQRIAGIRTVHGLLELPPDRRAASSTQLGGVLKSLRVHRGDAVQPGDVLGEVSSMELRDLQLDLLRVHLDAVLWKETLSRRRQAGDAVSRRLVLETEARVRASETQVSGLTQKLRSLGLTDAQLGALLEKSIVTDSVPILATRSGIVVDFPRTLGQVVRADDLLFELHDPAAISVQVFINEQDSAIVQIGQEARVRVVAWPDHTLNGTVRRISPVIGNESRTLSVWIDFDEPPAIPVQHNMSARVTVTTSRGEPVTAIPVSAVVRDGLRSFVFVQQPDGRFQRRLIEIGTSDDFHVEVRSGLTLDEAVVTGGVSDLQTAWTAVR